jgi:hypothetical protein
MDKAARAEERAERETRSFDELHTELYAYEISEKRRKTG